MKLPGINKFKKVLLMLAGIVFAVFVSYSQSFVLTYEGKQLKPDTTINLSGDTGKTLKAIVYVTNINSVSVKVKSKKTEFQKVSGTENTFCWGYCFSPDTYVSPNEISIPAGGTNKTFYGEYYPFGNSGASIIAYTFFNSADEKDSVRFFVKYDSYNLGIWGPGNERQDFAFNIYPNPAKSFSEAEYDFKGDNNNLGFHITDINGKIVTESILKESKGKIMINTSGFQSGIYYYYLTDNKTIIKTGKLLVY